MLRRAALIPKYRSLSSGQELEGMLRNALKDSMRARDHPRTCVIKSVLGEIQTASKIPSSPSPSKLLSKAIARRKETIPQFLSNNPPRRDLAEAYQAEIEVLNEFLRNSESPKMDMAEMAKLVEEAIGTQGRVMGPVVKEVMRLAQGKAEGKDVALAVKRALQTVEFKQ